MSGGIIGKPLPRVDSPEKTMGQAIYSIDENIPGMLIAKIKSSTRPHAKIKSVDASQAEQLQGLRAIVTYQDASTNLAGKGAGIKILDDEVRYVGDEVLAVAADNEEIADKALSLIEVEYEDLPAVFDMEESLGQNAPLVHTEGNRQAPVMYVGKLVEIAETENLYINPKHPYTEALLSAVPKMDPDLRGLGKRIVLESDVADPANPPSGCYFHPRCRYAQSICSEEEPLLCDIGGEHYVACHFAEELHLRGVVARGAVS